MAGCGFVVVWWFVWLLLLRRPCHVDARARAAGNGDRVGGDRAADRVGPPAGRIFPRIASRIAQSGMAGGQGDYADHTGGDGLGSGGRGVSLAVGYVSALVREVADGLEGEDP